MLNSGLSRHFRDGWQLWLYERSNNGALTWEGTKKLRCLAKVFQCHKFEPEVEFILQI